MLSKIISEFSNLSLALKISISILTSTFAGAGFIGFISEYATYYYAISNGARLPVEGVPYLTVTVTLISLVLLFSIVLILISFSVYFYLTGLFLNKIISKKLSKLTKNVLFFTSMLPLFLIFLVIVAAVNTDPHHVYFKVVPVKYGFERYIPLIVTVFLTLLISLGFYLYPKTKNIFISITILFVSVVFSFSLFNSWVYEYLLRKTKMGGGHTITIKTKDNVLKSRLFLLTKENIMIYGEDFDELTEIPKNNIQEYSYDADIKTMPYF